MTKQYIIGFTKKEFEVLTKIMREVEFAGGFPPMMINEVETLKGAARRIIKMDEEDQILGDYIDWSKEK